MEKFIAYASGILSLVATALYAYFIVKFFREEALSYYDGMGKVITGIHVVVSVIATVLVLIGLFIPHTTVRGIAVGGLVVAILTGMRYYFIVSFSPPLWRSLLLLIPLALFGLFFGIEEGEIF
jgi:energy-coupling factor transporter transmembrane protein EcfT